LVLLSVVIAFLYSVADRKTDSPEKVSDIEASKPRKKRKELTLRDIKGLGKVAEDRLRSHGIDSLQKLLEADAVDVCCETGISEERITNWKRKAEELLAGRDF
jgi:nucleotidyltransferase/DNA polymerase involved in DNA repair